MSGWVTVTGPPRAICSLKIGITLPVEPSTLPKRTVTKRVWLSLRQRLDVDLGDALGDAHDRGRVDRLVGRDHDEFADAVRGGPGRQSCACRRTLFLIASPGFHSIIGTCLWAAACKTMSGEAMKDLLHANLVADVGHAGNHVHAGIILDQLAVNMKQAVLGVLDQQQAVGLEPADGAAQLRADAAAGAGDEDFAAIDKSGDGLEVEFHRFAAQQILDGHVAHGRQIDFALKNVADSRNDLGRYAATLAQFHDPAQGFPGRVAHGDESLLGTVHLGESSDLRHTAQDGYAVNDHAGFVDIVIKKA